MTQEIILSNEEYQQFSQIIPIKPHVIGNNELHQTVIGRDLHKGLGIARDYTNWCKDQASRANLVQGVEFEIFNQSVVFAQQGVNYDTFETRGRPAIEYVFTLAAAKKIAMMSETIKGEEVREYFLMCEGIARNTDLSIQIGPVRYSANSSKSEMSKAISFLIEDNERKDEKIQVLNFDNTAFKNNNERLVALESDISMNRAVRLLAIPKLGRTKLMAYLRDNKMLLRQATSRNLPSSQMLNYDYMKVCVPIDETTFEPLEEKAVSHFTAKGFKWFKENHLSHLERKFNPPKNGE